MATSPAITCCGGPPSYRTWIFASFTPGVRGATRMASKGRDSPGDRVRPEISVTVVHLQDGTARTKRTGLLVPLVIWKVCECSEPGSMSPSSNLAGAALTVPEGGGLTGAVVPGDDATGVIGSFGAGSVALPPSPQPTRARRTNESETSGKRAGMVGS